MSPSYGSLDTDGDGTIDRNEFRAGFDQLGYWNRWDSDRDGQLGRDEFNTGLYDVWDADSDGAIAQNEFGNLVERNWL
jgi:Ca2+-binding EF-hand superfamily protein